MGDVGWRAQMELLGDPRQRHRGPAADLCGDEYFYRMSLWQNGQVTVMDPRGDKAGGQESPGFVFPVGLDFVTVIISAGLTPFPQQITGFLQEPFPESLRAVIPSALEGAGDRADSPHQSRKTKS